MGSKPKINPVKALVDQWDWLYGWMLDLFSYAVVQFIWLEVHKTYKILINTEQSWTNRQSI